MKELQGVVDGYEVAVTALAQKFVTRTLLCHAATVVRMFGGHNVDTLRDSLVDVVYERVKRGWDHNE